MVYGNVSLRLILFSSLAVFFDFSHLFSADELIIRAEPADLVQVIGELLPGIQRHVALVFNKREVHLPERRKDLAAGVLFIKFLLQQPVDQQCQETGQEMCFDPVLPPYVYRPCGKLRLHDPEAFFDLPAPLTDLYDFCRIIIIQVRTYSIESVIHGLFSDLFLIQVVLQMRLFPIVRNGNLSDKPARVMWVLSLLPASSVLNHLYSPFNLLGSDLFLVSSILGRVGDNHSLLYLFPGIGLLFIEQAVKVLRLQFGDINRLVIGQSTETGRIKGGFPASFGQLLQGLGNNESAIMEMIELPVLFRSEPGVTAEDEPAAPEVVDYGLFQRLKRLLLILAARKQ